MFCSLWSLSRVCRVSQAWCGVVKSTFVSQLELWASKSAKPTEKCLSALEKSNTECSKLWFARQRMEKFCLHFFHHTLLKSICISDFCKKKSGMKFRLSDIDLKSFQCKLNGTRDCIPLEWSQDRVNGGLSRKMCVISIEELCDLDSSWGFDFSARTCDQFDPFTPPVSHRGKCSH